jgi:hypothetical protein
MPNGLGFFATAGASSGPALGPAFDHIATTTTTSTTDTITISGFNTADYSGFRIIGNMQSPNNPGYLPTLWVQVNSLTTSDLYFHSVVDQTDLINEVGQGNSGTPTGLQIAYIPRQPNEGHFTPIVIDVFNSQKHGTTQARFASGFLNGFRRASLGEFNASQALSTLTFRTFSDALFSIGTSFSVYGVR